MAPHPPLWKTLENLYFSTRSHKTFEKHSASRPFYLFAHLDLLPTDSFSSTSFSSDSFSSDSSLLWLLPPLLLHLSISRKCDLETSFGFGSYWYLSIFAQLSSKNSPGKCCAAWTLSFSVSSSLKPTQHLLPRPACPLQRPWTWTRRSAPAKKPGVLSLGRNMRWPIFRANIEELLQQELQ